MVQATLQPPIPVVPKKQLLSSLEHRPWPLPDRPWAVAMSWHDLLFIHWPVAVSALLPLLPGGLQLDTIEGQAWLGIVPFRMSQVRRRGLPAFPGCSRFPELNLRTYVRHEDKPGVWFFSLDAGNSVAVALARLAFHLPYYRAAMRCVAKEDEILYTSIRNHRKTGRAEFRARYGPVGSVRASQPGTLEHWLTERYCLYAADPRGQLYRGDIHHMPWPLQRAEVDLVRNTLPEAADLRVPASSPLVHFARRLDVVAWGLQRC